MNLGELKKRAQELKIKGYSKMDKTELENTVKLKVDEFKRISEYISFAKENGEKKYVSKSSYFEKFLGFCPKKCKRVNVEECEFCDFQLAVSGNLGNYSFPEQYIVCGYSTNVKREYDGIRIPFDRKAYIQNALEEKLHVYQCDKCEMIYIEKEIFDCSFEKKEDITTYKCKICRKKKLIK